MFNKQISKGHFKQRSKTNTTPFVILHTWHHFGGKPIDLEQKKNELKGEFMV
jgi:hypothetical protein